MYVFIGGFEKCPAVSLGAGVHAVEISMNLQLAAAGSLLLVATTATTTSTLNCWAHLPACLPACVLALLLLLLLVAE